MEGDLLASQREILGSTTLVFVFGPRRRSKLGVFSGPCSGPLFLFFRELTLHPLEDATPLKLHLGPKLRGLPFVSVVFSSSPPRAVFSNFSPMARPPPPPKIVTSGLPTRITGILQWQLVRHRRDPCVVSRPVAGPLEESCSVSVSVHLSFSGARGEIEYPPLDSCRHPIGLTPPPVFCFLSGIAKVPRPDQQFRPPPNGPPPDFLPCLLSSPLHHWPPTFFSSPNQAFPSACCVLQTCCSAPQLSATISVVRAFFRPPANLWGWPRRKHQALVFFFPLRSRRRVAQFSACRGPLS